MSVNGHFADQFSRVADELESRLNGDDELGAAIAVDLNGETVVDIWGGWADRARSKPWERDTIVNVWSTTKEITALAVLMLIDRGAVDPEAPVATYWPEFAQNGKERVLVRHLLSHTSGVSGWDQPFELTDMYDWDLSTSRLAAQAPWWEPGTASGYHANNYGHLLGEVVRRVTGKSLKQFVADEIAAPLNVDLQIGAKPEDDERCAELVSPPKLEIDFENIDFESPTIRTFTGPLGRARAANTIEWRRADMGGVNGHTNARALARTFSVISRGGEIDGIRLLSPETIDRIFEIQAEGVDLVLGVPLRFGLGFALPQLETIPYIPDGRVCFWGGWGGSMTVMFPDLGLTFSYVMNKMQSGIIGSENAGAYISAALQSVGGAA